ncbi:LptF/LptG family permease [Persicirhabdus sediminis]|uniref:LptF/LptG family permease n=1 Tax=Persicirhabdus sediminis TaxID=454144 RepID=A0A8J7MDC7_9BACT|nr:LptF/LptG family permease [Persicirhabdus sediminis]MBK1790561.1 LptF/LptG family permease [Persicirhabdus sediminis]
MRVLDRYIAKQVLQATIFGVAVLTAIMLLGHLFQQIRTLLVENGASPVLLLQFMAILVPYSLLYTVPWGFLASILLVFGRLSSENELVSIRMAGCSLLRTAMPVFIIAAILSMLAFWINTTVSPQSKDRSRTLLREIALNNPQALLQPGIVSNREEVKVFVEDMIKDDELKGLHLYQVNDEDNGGFPKSFIYAENAQLKVNKEARQISLKLKNVYAETRDADGKTDMAFIGEQEPVIYTFSKDNKREKKPSELTSWELIELVKSESIEAYQLAGKLGQPIQEKDPSRYNSMGHEVHKRYAFSLACWSLSLVGIPLGINARRKETSTGLAISLVIGLGYFAFFFIADEFNRSPAPTATILYWTPNLVCLLLSVWLFRRTRG